MTACVLSTVRRLSSAFKTRSRKITIHLSSSKLHVHSAANIFEPIPREELVPKFKSRLRDRQFLPGSTGGDFPQFLAEPRDSFPLGVRVNNRNQSSLKELTAKCMDYVTENFSRNPAILFRGLPAKTAEDFSIIARAIQGKTMTYEGGTGLRSQVDKRAGTYTSSEEPDCFTIQPHNEMSMVDIFPFKVFFFCVKEAADGCGGETPLVKNKELLDKLDTEVVRKFEEKKLQHVRYLPDKSRGEYMNWQHVFCTDNREDVEPQGKRQGYSVTWDSSGDLFLHQIRNACIPHPITGEKTWFNQVINHHSSSYKAMPRFIGTNIPDHKFPAHAYYGDGSDIEPEALQHIRATTWQCAVGFQWRSGDLLVLDNLTVQHARMGFTDRERKVLAYFTA